MEIVVQLSNLCGQVELCSEAYMTKWSFPKFDKMPIFFLVKI